MGFRHVACLPHRLELPIVGMLRRSDMSGKAIYVLELLYESIRHTFTAVKASMS